MKRGKKQRPPQVVTITKETQSRKKLDSLILMKRAVMVVLSVMAIVISINTATSLITNHTISLFAASTWDSDFDGDTIKVRAGNKIDLPIPEKFEHTFEGWYRDTAFTKPFNPEKDRVHRNTTLHARFERNEYTITLIDPRFYYKPDYTPQTFTRTVGTHFIFPGEPETPEGMTAPESGTFQGWSLTMHYEQPDYNKKKNIIAPVPGGTRYANFFRQNATYWAAWDALPVIENPHPEIITVDFVTGSSISERIGSFLLGYDLITDPMHYSFYYQQGFNARIPLTMPSMFYSTDNDQHAYFTVLNDGKTSFRFGGWYVQGDIEYTIYLDGETVQLGPLAAYVKRTGTPTLTFHAVWLEY